ncbi:putative acyl-CoA dehydrogenase [Gordonia araii NBRC 100433]|uniref:Putative acyl-CoA dehydrogenase n=1 Tax=Gordonia araii NBRC 100433 TaxID=1073574 RepID=G7H6X8_9ACTN|nr:hypothetical protein [Gordonia araii]GAB11603.1 putative acyl-CoA dehydrogenase [Gordonia araii NBRC 100433]
MSVSRQGAKVYELLSDCIAARGFENDMYFPLGAVAMMGLPRLEGTVHVNMALALKFLQGYLFNPSDPSLALLAARKQVAASPIPDSVFSQAFKASRAVIRAASPLVGAALPAAPAPALPPRRRDAVDDTFLFQQGPAQGLGAVAFHDWRAVYAGFAHLPNVKVLLDQIDAFQVFLGTSPLDKTQMRDLDLLLVVGDLFTTIAYGDLILQQASIARTDDDLVDSIFEVLVGDVATHALTLANKPSLSTAQTRAAGAIIARPVFDTERSDRVWSQARATAGVYEMKP